MEADELYSFSQAEIHELTLGNLSDLKSTSLSVGGSLQILNIDGTFLFTGALVSLHPSVIELHYSGDVSLLFVG